MSVSFLAESSSTAVEIVRSSPSAPISLKKIGKILQELFYQVVRRQDIGIQQPGDILLEKVRIPNEDPF